METNADVILDPRQEQMMAQLIHSGMDAREAKLRVMCIAKPPDHFQVINTPFQAYPKMLYHPDGRHQPCENPAQHEIAKSKGWSDTPTQMCLEKFQGGVLTSPADEFKVPLSVTMAAEKQHRNKA